MDKRFEDDETIWEGISKDLQHDLEQFVDEGTKKAPEPGPRNRLLFTVEYIEVVGTLTY